MGSVTWHGDAVAANVRSAMAQGLTAGAIKLQAVMKQNLSQASPPRSAPGDFPHKETGNLRRSIGFSAATPDALRSAAGVSLNVSAGSRRKGRGKRKRFAAGGSIDAYAIHLEFGTKKMAPRPWATRSYLSARNEILATIRRVAASRLRNSDA